MFGFKPKKIEPINVGKQSAVIWYSRLDQLLCTELTVIGTWIDLSGDDIYIKRASIKDLLERAHEKGFITLEVEDSKVRYIPVRNIVEVIVSPLEENWITPK